MWLGRIWLKPDLHPLKDKWHDKLEHEQVIVRDHLDEWEDDLWEEGDVNENRTPVS